ncbi:hypothetical protein C0J52_19732 [Blattella germanica]|nr:hypothetical protein C0J52_19732 [Blattella germanica]
MDPLHEAAKKVAESLGGDVKQTEMDIMSKLLAEESAKHGKGSKKSGNWRQSVRVDIFGGRPLNIFKDVPSEAKVADLHELSTWKKLVSRELRLAATQPPANIYEEMILWTEQGKLWHFPIDNERGMEDEKKTYFTEHVFLERHIESWCPKKGALRHFMELVCVGLSKNPYITVEMKLEHINWFRDYFENKKQVIEAAEAALALAAANSEVESKENL